MAESRRSQDWAVDTVQELKPAENNKLLAAVVLENGTQLTVEKFLGEPRSVAFFINDNKTIARIPIAFKMQGEYELYVFENSPYAVVTINNQGLTYVFNIKEKKSIWHFESGMTLDNVKLSTDNTTLLFRALFDEDTKKSGDGEDLTLLCSIETKEIERYLILDPTYLDKILKENNISFPPDKKQISGTPYSLECHRIVKNPKASDPYQATFLLYDKSNNVVSRAVILGKVTSFNVTVDWRLNVFSRQIDGRILYRQISCPVLDSLYLAEAKKKLDVFFKNTTGVTGTVLSYLSLFKPLKVDTQKPASEQKTCFSPVLRS